LPSSFNKPWSAAVEPPTVRLAKDSTIFGIAGMRNMAVNSRWRQLKNFLELKKPTSSECGIP